MICQNVIVYNMDFDINHIKAFKPVAKLDSYINVLNFGACQVPNLKLFL